jgi:very-short-patch-repair endonuclease
VLSSRFTRPRESTAQHVRQTHYDEQRTLVLQQRGFRVLRFWNDDVLLRTDVVAEVIYEALARAPSP